MQNFNYRYAITLILVMLAMAAGAGCSTTPGLPQQRSTVKNQATDHRGNAARALQRNQLAEAEALYTSSLRLSSSIDHGPGIVQALSGIAEIRRRTGDFDNASGLLQQAEAVALNRDLPDLLIRTRIGQAEVELARGRPEQGLVLLQDLDELTGSRTMEAALLARTRGIASRRLDRFDEAEQYLRQAAALARRNDDLLAAASAYYQLASVFARQERLDDARAYLMVALELDQQLENPGGIGASLEALAAVAARQGDTASQRQYLLRAYGVYSGIGDTSSLRRVQQRLLDDLAIELDISSQLSVWQQIMQSGDH
ncbi:tetratricopeptide repeat protein [Spirochaeta africana]|uniref:Uncharacterized protein n=1 Tax=Spirochaeta africana (strain ATCC 700263 / DSM 8902 / Z-7692) TaxID=889378 RepID=H9UKN7_SPIAZ|nr:tetratricopeptide repeat protein [Spirochaeta africana]AFG38080.1 hypothetical protein Spiaf_2031 [Spirochaeta africana DSM 8902]